MAKKSDKSDNKKNIDIENEEKLQQENTTAEDVKAEQQEKSSDEAEETSAGAEESAETEETAEPKKEATAEEKLAEVQDRYLRLSAEYDNFRKRTLREKIDLQKSANENLLGALLPVADDFDRAMQSLEEATDMKGVKEGMNLIFGKFNGFLGQQGIKEIKAVNKSFDTDLHEAITKIPAPTKKLKGKVVDVVQKGYYLNEKVLRFSKVVIGE